MTSPGYNQNIWGKYFWYLLHTISFNYPNYPTSYDKHRYKKFFMALKDILPCRYCRVNYGRNMREMPIKLNSKKDLVYWLIDLHNEVNAMTGKKPYSYNEVIKLYEKHLGKDILINDNYKTNCGIPHQNINILMIIIIIILIIYFVTKK